MATITLSKNGVRKTFERVGDKVLATMVVGTLIISNPSLDALYADGWVEYIQPAPTPAELLERAKSSKNYEIEVYNDSDAVNGFYINGEPQEWLTPAQRGNYRQTVEAAKRKGMTEISFAGHNIPVDVVLSAIDDLDLYAWAQTACCEACMAAVNNLTTIEDVDAYDYRSAFAQTPKPNFTIAL